MEAFDSNGLIEYLSNCIPWFAVALACFGNGQGFYDPMLPQLKDTNGNNISNYINIDYECEGLVVTANEITQGKTEILEILFFVNTKRQELENRFFKREPDVVVQNSYTMLDSSDSISNDSRIWTFPKYSISLSDRKEGCKVSISKKSNK